MNEETEKKGIGQSDEINLTDIVRKLWKGRKIILITLAVFFIVGIILALFSPRNYRSNVTLLVEPGGSNPAATSAAIRQLAVMSGVPIGESPDALTPALYPLVVGSTVFRLEMINQQVTDPKTGKDQTLSQFFDNHHPYTLGSVIMDYTIGLPGKIIGAIRGNGKQNNVIDSTSLHPLIPSSPSSIPGLRSSILGGPAADSGNLELTISQKWKIGVIKDRIKAEVKKTAGNMLMISVEMPDPKVATEIAGSVVNILTRYVVDYRTRKFKKDLQFMTDLHDEAERKYRQAQQQLASYRDRNQNVIMASARTEEERLQSEYNLAFGVYNNLSQLLEQSKIKVQENTPVFTLIDPPSEAVKTTSSGSMILIMLFLGLLTGAAIVFGKPAYARLKKQLK